MLGYASNSRVVGNDWRRGDEGSIARRRLENWGVVDGNIVSKDGREVALRRGRGRPSPVSHRLSCSLGGLLSPPSTSGRLRRGRSASAGGVRAAWAALVSRGGEEGGRRRRAMGLPGSVDVEGDEQLGERVDGGQEGEGESAHEERVEHHGDVGCDAMRCDAVRRPAGQGEGEGEEVVGGRGDGCGYIYKRGDRGGGDRADMERTGRRGWDGNGNARRGADG